MQKIIKKNIRLCIKVGRGQGDGDIGTRVWGLGTWGRETRDLRTSNMGRGDVWDGDVKNRNAGDAGCEELLQKSEVNAISLSSRKCVIYIMVNIRFHLPKPHWTPYDNYTQNFFIIGVRISTVA